MDSRFRAPWYKNTHWPTTLFFVLNPTAAILGTFWAFQKGLITGPLLIFAALFGIANNLAVTAGYHRLYSHRTYSTQSWIEWIYLLVGASAWQGSVLKWSSDHRRHHLNIDSEKDPYNIQYGFWYAHMGWLFRKDAVDLEIYGVQDLQKNPRVVFQHKFYLPLAILISYGLPMIFGYFQGSAAAGLFVAGCLRITLSQQSTFFVNSLSHSLGKRPYSREISARDSLLVAFLTHGEGYHNFHHKFQFDFRNGIRWYHWDPTKWVILTLKTLGLATRLKQVSAEEILKARLEVEAGRLEAYGWSKDRIERIREKILQAQARVRSMKSEYQRMKKLTLEAQVQNISQFQMDLKRAQQELSQALKSWRFLLRYPQRAVPLYSKS
jgi:stearoyl-CoA desaturase (delta-9 desaturase)